MSPMSSVEAPLFHVFYVRFKLVDVVLGEVFGHLFEGFPFED
jgi:hypothetical protein